MKILKRFGQVVIALVVVLGIVRFTPLWDRLLSPGNHEPFAFQTASLPQDRENHFLLCPTDFCAAETPHQVAPVLDITKDALLARLIQVTSQDITVDLISQEGDTLTLLYRTPQVRWPDWVDIHVIAVSAEQSSLAIYSQSVYGRKDFGANATRVEMLLDAVTP